MFHHDLRVCCRVADRLDAAIGRRLDLRRLRAADALRRFRDFRVAREFPGSSWATFDLAPPRPPDSP